jgi:putative oxidoreductase
MDSPKSLTPLITKGYELLIKFGNCLQPFVLLIFRLYWGWQFFLTGKGKLLNHPKVVEFFTSLGIPAPGLNAWFIGGLECFGGLLLLVGFCSRPIAFLMTCNMTVAYLSVAEDRAKVFSIFQDPAPFLAADPFFFMLMSVLVLAFGPGCFSVDAIIKKKILKR